MNMKVILAIARLAPRSSRTPHPSRFGRKLYNTILGWLDSSLGSPVVIPELGDKDPVSKLSPNFVARRRCTCVKSDMYPDYSIRALQRQL